MAQLYVHDNGPPAGRVIQRAALLDLVAAGHDVVVGCSRGDGELFRDLPVRVLEAPLRSHVRGALVDLVAWCPPGHRPLDVSLKCYRDTHSPQWRSVATVFNRRLRKLGLEPVCDADRDPPLLQYPREGECVTSRVKRPTVYVETRRWEPDDSWFVFDFDRMLAVLPDHDFACTEPPSGTHDRILDLSDLGLLQQARTSEACDILLGTTWQPFIVTMSEPNRHRPKAICGHDRYLHATVWDYPDSPLEYLETMDQLCDFLRCQAHVRRARPAELGA